MIYENPVKPDYSSYDIEGEANLLKQFVDTRELWIPENFYENIRRGDVIDLYENPPSMKQLYCNTLFRQLCSYSDEQMRQVSFTKLFWRSEEIQKQIVQRATIVALQKDQAEAWGIEAHELIESLHPRKRTFEIDLGFLAPCLNKNTRERVAFVSSLRVNLIFEWPEAQTPA